MTGITTLIGWFFYGFVRYVMYWIPLIAPSSVNRHIPWQWWLYNNWGDWRHRDDNNGGPDEHWLQCWFKMLFGEAMRLATYEAKPYVRLIRDALLVVIGAVKSGFGSLSSWVDWLEQYFGFPLPWWSSTVKSGLGWLRRKLPSGIRESWQTWLQIWDGIKQEVRDWAIARYDQFRNLANEAVAWVRDRGASLSGWQDRVGAFIEAFKANPYGNIAWWLGEAWSWLCWFRSNAYNVIRGCFGPNLDKILLFGRDCVTFYYNLWAQGWQELGGFTSNPVQYLYDKAEQILTERW